MNFQTTQSTLRLLDVSTNLYNVSPLLKTSAFLNFSLITLNLFHLLTLQVKYFPAIKIKSKMIGNIQPQFLDILILQSYKQMSWNNKMFISVQQQERQNQKKMKRSKNNQIEEGKQEMSFSPIRTNKSINHLNRPKTNLSNFKKNQSKFIVSPSVSGVTSNQQYFKEMSAAMLSQNKNLRQHNEFLKKQIQVMFERQKRYKSHLILSKQKIQRLEEINTFLSQQFDILINNTIGQIDRIQKIIQEQNRYSNILSSSSPISSKKFSQGQASQTQTTIQRDLQEFKGKVRQIYSHKKSAEEKQNACFRKQARENKYMSKHGLKAEIPIPQAQEKNSPDNEQPRIVINRRKRSSERKIAQ